MDISYDKYASRFIQIWYSISEKHVLVKSIDEMQ